MTKERLAAFTDAVLAIIMTILVLELERPETITWTGFWELRENFFAYSLSFFWLGAMWANLHNEWYTIKTISRKTIWATLLMLFFSSLFPYATSIVATNFYNSTAQSFYGAIVLLVTFSNTLSYSTLFKINKTDPYFHERMNFRNGWVLYDIVIKIAGLTLSLTIFPEAMSYAVLITLIVFVIPNQLKYPKEKNLPM